MWTGRMPRLIWVFAGHTCQFVGFVMRRLICLESLMGWAMYWGRGRATKSYKTWGAQIGSDSSVSKLVCFRTSYIPLPRGFELHWGWISTDMNQLMIVTVSGFAVVSQSISELHGRDLHWLFSISRQARPPSCNTHSVKCYAPVICNHVS